MFFSSVFSQDLSQEFPVQHDDCMWHLRAQAAERLSQMEMQRAAAAPSELVKWFPNTTTRNSKGGILLWGGWTIITTKICQFLTLSCYSSWWMRIIEHGNFGDWSQSFHDLQSVFAETLAGWGSMMNTEHFILSPLVIDGNEQNLLSWKIKYCIYYKHL